MQILNADLKIHPQQIPSGFSMSTISSFKRIENKHDACRGKNCMKKFYEFCEFCEKTGNGDN